MVWDSLSKKEKEKFQQEVDDNLAKLLKDKEFLKHFSISEEEAQAQLAKRPKPKE